jgi:MFS family permease
MLPTRLRQRINGLRLTLTEGGKLPAPLLGAGLFALLGGGPVAAIDAATFVVAAFTTSRLRVSEPSPADRPVDPTPWRAKVLAGFAHLRSLPGLWVVVVAGAAAMEISGLGVAAQYSLVDALGEPPAFLGALTAALGAGSIVAGLTSARMIDRFGEHRLALLGLADFAVGALMRSTGWLPAAVAGSLVLGFALPWSVLAVINLTQRRTPDALQGRVAAVVTLALFAPLPLTQAIGAAIIGPLGYRGVYLLNAALVLLTALWLWGRQTMISRSATN